jgi:hypothetical protein
MKDQEYPEGTTRPVDWDEALRRMLAKYPGAQPADPTVSATEQILQARATKDPKLAAKQARLIETLRANPRTKPRP